VNDVSGLRGRTFHELLLSALSHDAYLRYDCDPSSLEDVEIEPGQAVAWTSWHPHRAARWLTALSAEAHAPAGAAVDVASRLASRCEREGRPLAGITMSRREIPMVPLHLQPTSTDEWDWWYIDAETERASQPSPSPLLTWAHSVPVVDLDPEDPRINALLAVASPSAPIRPGDPRVSRWAGIEEPSDEVVGTGGLVAVVAVLTMESGAVHLNDVATHPVRRGRGMARVLCASVTRDALDQGSLAVTLGMYANNDAARSVYSSLGFRCARRNSSGTLSQA